MRFKLRRLVCSVSWSLSLLYSFSSFADADQFSIRGRVPALSTLNIETFALRPDGRYLFYASNGSSSWGAVDLQNMAFLNDSEVTVDAEIVEMSFVGDSVLVVVTKEGVQRFNVSTPYDPEEQTGDFEIDTGSLSQEVVSACVDSNSGRAFLLEVDASSEIDHFLRVVSGSSEVERVSWRTLFGTDSASGAGFAASRRPFLIRCTDENIIIFARSTLTDDEDDNKFFIGRVPIGSPSTESSIFDVSDVSELDNYDLVDYNVSPDGANVILVYEEQNTEESLDGAKAVRVNVSGATLETASVILAKMFKLSLLIKLTDKFFILSLSEKIPFWAKVRPIKF